MFAAHALAASGHERSASRPTHHHRTPARHTIARTKTPIQPGEAYVTRFSGTQPGAGGPVIDTNGTVGSIIDLRAPRMPPLGQHWVDEPQRKPVTAGQVGQVFGVTLDDANPPNIYLTATSAFGLHRAGNDWMPGMWGQGGARAPSTGSMPRPAISRACSRRSRSTAGRTAAPRSATSPTTAPTSSCSSRISRPA